MKNRVTLPFAGAILALATTFISFFCQAQMVTGLNKDSLYVLLGKTGQDTTRVNLLIIMGQQFETNDPDSALYYYDQAGRLSRKIDYPAGILKYISNYTAVLNVQDRLEESIRLNLEAVTIGEKYNLTIQTAKAYANLGAVYQYQENYENAVKYYLKALPFIEQNGEAQARATILVNLCGVYRSMNQSDKAIDYAKRALVISEQANDLYSQGQACVNLGNCFKDIGDNGQAEFYYRKVEAIAKDRKDVNLLETALINLGNVYLSLDLPQKYIPTFKEALGLTDSIHDVGGKAFVLLGIGEGLYRQQLWKPAEAHLRSAILFSKQHDQKEILQKLYQVMADVYVATHRFDDARLFRSRHDSVEVNLVNAGILQSVQSLEAEYKIEQKQNELLLKDLELQRTQNESIEQKYWLMASSVGVAALILMLVLSYLFYRQKQQLDKQTIERLEADKKTVRLQSLLEGQQQERIRISQEIHDDLGSGLTSVLFISRSLTASGADALSVSKLTSLAGTLIDKMNEIVWAMRGEPELLDDFILNLRSLAGDLLGTASIDFDFHIEEPVPQLTLPTEYRHPLYLVVKEAIHNIIKHSSASRVKFSMQFTPSWTIDIWDNGTGISSTRAAGNGLRNMKKRIAAIRGQLSIRSDQGTHVHIEVPGVI